MTLQELILTDESLQFCKGRGAGGGVAVYDGLFKAIQTGTYSALTLLDLSRNTYSFDGVYELHEALIEAIVGQAKAGTYLETLILTTSDSTIKARYTELVEQREREPDFKREV